MGTFNEKYFGSGNADGYNADALLSEGETVLWRGKPYRKAYILAQVFKMLPIAVIWLIFDGSFLGVMIAFDAFSQIGTIFTIVIALFFVLHLTPVWIWIHNIVTAGKRHKNTDYLITDKRILIKSGFIGIDVANIYYTDIESVNLRVGVSDRIFKVGDIYISGSFKAQVLWDIKNPYEVVTMLQKIVHDIKTDTYFPNDLRPEANHGYNTKYEIKKDDNKNSEN